MMGVSMEIDIDAARAVSPARPVRPFEPPLWLRPGIVQTALASLAFRKRGPNPMLDAAEDRTIECADGVRLKGSYSRAPENRALVIFLHGWEGSQDSTYVVSCGRYLYERGASVFRLNYRDHGNSHDLNEGLFYSTRFNEVFDAVQQAARLGNGAPVHIVGFSLGGNFALRVARSLRDLAIPKLRRIYAISPVVDPWGAAPLVDANWLYRRYFLRKWGASLRRKQALYPDLYDFSDILAQKRVLGMTERLLPRYSRYERMEDYFNAYRVDPDDLSRVPVPVDIITARDDGMIPERDVRRLRLAPGSRMIVHDHGGHNGFFQSLLGPTWYDEHIAADLFGPPDARPEP
ncbi:MAG: alpha/beta fold hydrolase [Litorimonas sp.]